MKKIVVSIGLAVIFLCFNQAMARDCANKRFSLQFGFGESRATNHELNELAGGSDKSWSLGVGYRLRKQATFNFHIGLEGGRLPLRGNEWNFITSQGIKRHYADWKWSYGVLYGKISVGKGALSPFAKIGFGLYHLSLKYPFPYFYQNGSQWRFWWEIKDISKTYLGFIGGTGLQLTFRCFSFFGEVEYNTIVIYPSLQLPLAPEVKNANIVNFRAGISVLLF